MIILKYSGDGNFTGKVPDNDYLRIAKYMINMMAGMELFDSEGNFNPDSTIKFPKLIVDGVELYIKAVHGIVYFPQEILDEFYESVESTLITLIKKLENDYLANTKYSKYLNGYHTVSNGMYTNLKVKNATVIISDGKQKRAKNTRIQFHGSSDLDIISGEQGEYETARFTWFLTSLESHDFNISNNDKNLAICRNLCSITYDPYDIIDVADNVFITTFKQSNLYSYKSIVPEYVRICPYYNPICLELNTTWESLYVPKETGSTGVDVTNSYSGDTIYTFSQRKFRSVDSRKVFQGKLDEIEIKPVVNKDTMEKQYNICVQCGSELYDDNYVLCVKTRNPVDKLGRCICPLCLHTSRGRHHDASYVYIKRVTFPRTITDAIAASPFSHVKKDIMTKLTKANINDVVSSKYYKYLDIGDYIGVQGMDEYLFSKFAKQAANEGKKIFEMVMTN